MLKTEWKLDHLGNQFITVFHCGNCKKVQGVIWARPIEIHSQDLLMDRKCPDCPDYPGFTNWNVYELHPGEIFSWDEGELCT